MVKESRLSIIFSLTLWLLIFSSNVLAQQDPHFTHYMFNQSMYNPAHYGLSDGISATGIYRNQWLGMKDPEGNIVSPVTIQASADAPIRLIHGGVGISVMQDKIAFTKNMNVKLGYAYHANIGRNVLSIGTNVDLSNISHDNEKYQTTDNEPINISKEEASMVTDMAVGIFFKAPNYYISLSSNKVLESKSKSNIAFDNTRHYFMSFGYQFTHPAYQGFEFMPSAIIYSDSKTVQSNVSFVAKYNNKIWGGVGYRFQDAVNLLVGMKFNDIEIGYSFDVPMNGLGIRTFGSHEILARYVFKIEREKSKTGHRNTRFL